MKYGTIGARKENTMKLIPGDEITQQDLHMQVALRSHPELKRDITLIIGGYRELAMMIREGQDTADLSRSIAKKDNVLRRLDIPILDTLEDWMKVRSAQQYTVGDVVPISESLWLRIEKMHPENDDGLFSICDDTGGDTLIAKDEIPVLIERLEEVRKGEHS